MICDINTVEVAAGSSVTRLYAARFCEPPCGALDRVFTRQYIRHVPNLKLLRHSAIERRLELKESQRTHRTSQSDAFTGLIDGKGCTIE